MLMKKKSKNVVESKQEIPGILAHDDTDYTLNSNLRRIVVLGSNHLSSYIVLHLLRLQNIEIHVIDRKDPHQILLNSQMVKYRDDNRVYYHHWSERDFQLNFIDRLKFYDDKPIDTVINGLYVQDELYSEINPIETMNTNAVWTSILMETLRKGDFEGTLIHLGTAKIYGVKSNQTVDIKPIPEGRPPEPKGMKAVSRYVQENIITGMAKTYDINYLVLRLGTIYGIFTPREHVLNTWIRSMLLQNNLRVNGKGHESRDFTHVYDVAELVCRLVNKNRYQSIANEIYNIGSGVKQETRLGNIADAILGFLRPYSPESKVIKGDYLVSEDKDYRELLDCSKAEQKLKYYPFVGFDAIKLLMGNVPYIAKYELGFSEKEMLKINTLCNRFDMMNRARVAEEAGLDLNTEDGQKYIEKQVAAILNESQKQRMTSLQQVLGDPKSEAGQQLRKFMNDNNLSLNDVSDIVK